MEPSAFWTKSFCGRPNFNISIIYIKNHISCWQHLAFDTLPLFLVFSWFGLQSISKVDWTTYWEVVSFGIHLLKSLPFKLLLPMMSSQNIHSIYVPILQDGTSSSTLRNQSMSSSLVHHILTLHHFCAPKSVAIKSSAAKVGLDCRLWKQLHLQISLDRISHKCCIKNHNDALQSGGISCSNMIIHNTGRGRIWCACIWNSKCFGKAGLISDNVCWSGWGNFLNNWGGAIDFMREQGYLAEVCLQETTGL